MKCCLFRFHTYKKGAFQLKLHREEEKFLNLGGIWSSISSQGDHVLNQFSHSAPDRGQGCRNFQGRNSRLSKITPEFTITIAKRAYNIHFVNDST